MTPFDSLWPWLTLVALGAFHGLNPAMGWLFAVAIGFQEGRTRAVVSALGPIALGHALAIACVAVPIGLLQIVLPREPLLVMSGLALILYAAYKVATRFKHPRWVGMRVRRRELITWSALMAAAHGAGLMLIPALAGLSSSETPSALAGSPHVGHHQNHVPDEGESLVTALAAVTLHTAAMVVVMGILAFVVYRWIGVEILRRAWINLDLIWTGALALAGVITITLGAWSLIV